MVLRFIAASKGYFSVNWLAWGHTARGWHYSEMFFLDFYYQNVPHIARDEKAAKWMQQNKMPWGKEWVNKWFSTVITVSGLEQRQSKIIIGTQWAALYFSRDIDFKCSCSQFFGRLLFLSVPIDHPCHLAPKRLKGISLTNASIKHGAARMVTKGIFSTCFNLSSDWSRCSKGWEDKSNCFRFFGTDCYCMGNVDSVYGIQNDLQPLELLNWLLFSEISYGEPLPSLHLKYSLKRSRLSGDPLYSRFLRRLSPRRLSLFSHILHCRLWLPYFWERDCMV